MGLGGQARFHLDDLLDECEHVSKRRDKYCREIVRIVSCNRDMIRVMQSPGIGIVTAFALVASVHNSRTHPKHGLPQVARSKPIPKIRIQRTETG